MKKVALSVSLKAKPGKEEEVAAFLAGALSLVAQEAGTITWYAFRVDQRTFGIFDSFGSDEARQAHLQGAVAAALLPPLTADPLTALRAGSGAGRTVCIDFSSPNIAKQWKSSSACSPRTGMFCRN